MLLNGEGNGQPTPVLLPGKFHGWRSLVGCSPWGLEESDMTEWLHFHFSLSSIGEGNGNPLQCSCLENPRDGGVWWAAVYGVAQSRTRLKWITISSSAFKNVCQLSITIFPVKVVPGFCWFSPRNITFVMLSGIIFLVKCTGYFLLLYRNRNAIVLLIFYPAPS